MEIYYIDKFGNPVELRRERWAHIAREHPEVVPFKNRIGEVLKDADYIKRSVRDINVLMYYKYYNDIFSGKYLLVVVKKAIRSFILTCYITDMIKKGETLWAKK